MDMFDTIPVPPDECGRIDTGIGRMSGIHQQAHLLAGHRHQAIDFGLALDHGPHMVMVDKPDAACGHVAGKPGQPGAKIVPVADAKPGPARQRMAPITGDAAARFGIDQYGATHRDEQGGMRLDRRDLRSTDRERVELYDRPRLAYSL